jgi:polysaccharide pyruvyl transferase WcaK-like protein
MYLWTTFRLYRHLDLKTWCLFQGAGPLSTKLGRWLAGSVLREVDIFVARDLGTFTLINQISPGIKSVLAHDAIFLPGFENDLVLDNLDEQRNFGRIVARDDRPVIGFNIRQWFHFVSSILPYQFSQGMYKKRSKDKMFDLIQASISWIRLLRTRENVRVVLLSAYQPGVVPWEDDLPWLMEVKTAFRDDDEVLLIDKPMSMPLYYAVMSSLDLMIGMRLHSSLISLRFGVPSLNLSYTLKGRDILNHLGLPEYIVDLQTFMDNPEGLFNRVVSHLQNHDLEHEKVTQTVNRAIDQNMKILKSLLAADRF